MRFSPQAVICHFVLSISRRYGPAFLPAAVKGGLFGVNMKIVATALLFCSLVSSQFAFADSFPRGPIAQLTPGVLCSTPNSHRYPEKIAYCERDVLPSLKEKVMEEYDRRFGFQTEQMPRGVFKIDHYIPLCMGGANVAANLWPQHVSIYKITDPLEQELCTKMAEGKILQKEAVQLIKEAKNNLDDAPIILRRVRAL